jgi:valyl-tRNA synthetase
VLLFRATEAAEEVWSWWNEGSVHRAAWPAEAETAIFASADQEVLTVARDVIAAVRKAKSEAQLSVKSDVEAIEVTSSAETVERMRLAESDLRAAGHIGKIEYVMADGEMRVTVSL